MSFSFGTDSFLGHSGSAPSPFDAINGTRLAGAEQSHPLHFVRPEELLKPVEGPLSGEMSTAASGL